MGIQSQPLQVAQAMQVSLLKALTGNYWPNIRAIFITIKMHPA
jgi:hypothetical protein